MTTTTNRATPAERVTPARSATAASSSSSHHLAMVRDGDTDMTDPSWSQLLLADVRDIKEMLSDLSVRVNRNEMAQASMEQQLKALQRAPETIRNWGTFALYAIGSVASGFGCIGCLGSAVSLVGAVVAVVAFFTTHH